MWKEVWKRKQGQQIVGAGLVRSSARVALLLDFRSPFFLLLSEDDDFLNSDV